jgi:hypothetical protein
MLSSVLLHRRCQASTAANRANDPGPRSGAWSRIIPHSTHDVACEKARVGGSGSSGTIRDESLCGIVAGDEQLPLDSSGITGEQKRLRSEREFGNGQRSFATPATGGRNACGTSRGNSILGRGTHPCRLPPAAPEKGYLLCNEGGVAACLPICIDFILLSNLRAPIAQGTAPRCDLCSKS